MRLGHYWFKTIFIAVSAVCLVSCGNKSQSDSGHNHRLAVIAPGHFHASLVQKNKVDGISDSVDVYALDSASVSGYRSLIESYNCRHDNPTSWNLNFCFGDGFLDSMRNNHRADIAVIAGNNRNKTDYILAAIESGMNVLADKPLAINADDYDKLKTAYRQAHDKGLTICELMTERYDTLNIIVKSLIADKELFGELIDGTDDMPAIEMNSVHHFYKNVSGNPLIRPVWYYDVEQQGKGISDVTTHLIDLVFWQAFPDVAVDICDIDDVEAVEYPTHVSLDQFALSTASDPGAPLPDFLEKYRHDEYIDVLSNGRLRFSVKNKKVDIGVEWKFEAPEGSGDVFTAVYRGTKGNIIVRQDASTDYVKEVYFQNLATPDVITKIEVAMADRLPHEEHFRLVLDKFLKTLDGTEMSDWEDVNTLTKYYITAKSAENAIEVMAID